jgi:hypothetical protein
MGNPYSSELNPEMIYSLLLALPVRGTGGGGGGAPP